MTPRRNSGRRGLCLAGLLLLTAGLPALTQAAPGASGQSLSPVAPTNFWEALRLDPASEEDAWSRLRANFQWQQDIRHERVQKWIEHYRSSPDNVVAITERASTWLHWIIQQLEARDLPGEIALLPFVESSFDPVARSARGASGLWQFMPGTADALGLPRSPAYDGRLDVVASTHAALDYLEDQAERWYDGDLELALAAYNAGAGTVNNARRAAAQRGEPDDYWHLRLPGETMQYLPKLLAISAIIHDPERYDIALPEIEDTPAFAEVELEDPLNLDRAAALAGTTREELEALNPGLLNGTLSPSHSTVLLVPTDSHETLVANLEAQPAGNHTSDEEVYVVQRGDSLSAIAARHGVTLSGIREHNGLQGDMIREGQNLNIPQPSMARAQASRN